MRIAEQSLPVNAALATKADDFARLDREAESAYWLRFPNGRWLIYRHERLIGDFPAVAFLRRKQGEGGTG
jgi:hypothetical protein